MATSASPSTPVRISQGIAPLGAGHGRSFLLRKLHSLSGIIPVGAFLVEHFVSNAFATRGPGAYSKQVELLSSFPFVFYLELFGIWLPILYHAFYGFYIWFRGESNLTDYPWAGNWMFTAQRWTGGIAFFYIVWHTWHLRFSGVHILSHPDAAFGKVQLEFQHAWVIVFTPWEFSAPPGTSPTDCGCLPPSGGSRPETRPDAGLVTSASPSERGSFWWER